MTAKPPISGRWVALDSAVVGEAATAISRGAAYDWNHPAVQTAPSLFAPADLSARQLAAAMKAHEAAQRAAPDAKKLSPGPGVVRCRRVLRSALPDGPNRQKRWLQVLPGRLVLADEWFVTRWPAYFEPSGEDIPSP